MFCTYCGSGQHEERLCPKTASGQSARLHLRCDNCGGRDHDSQACPKNGNGSDVRRRYAPGVSNHFILDR